MTPDQLKRIVACSQPAGISREGLLIFTFDALAESAAKQGVELKSKRMTFTMLCDEMGFSRTNSAGERRIAATWQTVLSIVLLSANEILAQYVEAL